MGRLAALLLLVALLCPASVAAQRLPRTVVPEHYDLAITVDLVHASFEGTEHIRVHVGAPTTQIVLNAAGLTIQAASLGRGPSAQAADVALDAVAETATFTVPRPVSGSTDIDLHYSARLNDDLRGFYISQGELRTYAVTQFESTDARRAFPCFDEPEYKATFALRLTIARRDVAISNGRVVSDTPGPGPDQHTVVFSTSPRMSSYLVAMAVGDFQCLEAVTDGIPLRVCAAPDKKNLAHF
ncbi:MAG: M1 family peptidase, partial [Acidobacteriota bacterium]